jgi:hypothetical protein
MRPSTESEHILVRISHVDTMLNNLKNNLKNQIDNNDNTKLYPRIEFETIKTNLANIFRSLKVLINNKNTEIIYLKEKDFI